MNILSLFVAAFAAAGAWAETPRPIGFFAYDFERYIPLAYYEGRPGQTSEFRFNKAQNPSAVVVEQQGESFFAKTSSGVVGFKDSYLAHGSELEKEGFQVHPVSKQVLGSFFFCQKSGKLSRVQIPDEDCSRASLHLSPFDRETGAISPNEDLSPESDITLLRDSIPHTLFAEDTVFGAPRPVFTSPDGRFYFMRYDIFHPERFYYEKGFLLTKDPSPKHVGFEKDMLVLTSSSSPFSFTISEDPPIVQTELFGCRTTQVEIFLISHSPGPGCSPIKLEYSLYWNNGQKGKVGSAFRETNVYVPSSGNPLVLFAKVSGKYHSLSSFHQFDEMILLTYGSPLPPIEISLENGYAVPINTINTGPAGVFNGQLGFGHFSDDQKLKLDLDEDGMLIDKSFFSCEIVGDKFFVIEEKSSESRPCLRADIYVGRFDRQTGNYIKYNPHRPDGEGNNGSDRALDGPGGGETSTPVADPPSNTTETKAHTPKKNQDNHGSQNPSDGTNTDEAASHGGKKGQDSNPKVPKANDRPERGQEPKKKDEPEKGHEPSDGNNKDQEPKKDEPGKGHEQTEGDDKDQEPKKKDEPERGHEPSDGNDKGQEPKKKDEPERGHEPSDGNNKDQEPKKKDEPERGHEPSDDNDKGQEPKKKGEPAKGHEPSDDNDKGQEPKKKDEPDKGHEQKGDDKDAGQKFPVSKPDHQAEPRAHSKDMPADDVPPNVPGASSGSGSRSSTSKIDDMVHGTSDISSTSQDSNVTSSDSRMHQTHDSTQNSVSNTSEYRFYDIFQSTNRSHVTEIRGGDCPECGDMNNADASGQHSRPIREAASATTICDECAAATKIVWNTCTDYTTYCSSKTTLTISKCEDVCSQTMVTVSAPTMFTCPGVCIIPETVAERVTRSGVEAAAANRVAVETGDARGAINAPKSVSPLSAKEGRKSSESTKDNESSEASSEQGIKSEQEIRPKDKEFGSKKHEQNSSDEKEIGSKKHGISLDGKEVESRKHGISSDEEKVGSNDKGNRKGEEHASERRPSISSNKGNASEEQSNDVPKPKAARLTGDSARSSKTRPVVHDETSTSTLTNTFTKPGVTPYGNGASRMPAGAFLFVLASLLM